jgi:L-lactate permease
MLTLRLLACFALRLTFNRIFCFAYMIEGASGFGTPVALGAPMLVSTGHSKIKSVVTLLVMNTFATVWGAVGTPIWFGFSGIFEADKEEDAFIQISYKAGVCLAVCAFLLVPLLLCIICPWVLVKKNLLFIYLSLVTVVGPSLGLSFGTYEFPALIGGMIGCGGTAVLIKFKVGLSTLEDYLINDDGKNPMDIGSVSEVSVVKKIERAQSVASSAAGNSSRSAVRKNYKHAFSTVSDVTTDEFKQSGRVAEEVIPEENGDAIEVEDKKITPEDGNGVANGEDAALKESGGNFDDMPIINTPDTFKESENNNLISQQDELEAILGPRKEYSEGYIKELVIRTSPIWLVILILVLTRVTQIGLKDYLTRTEPNFAIFFGTYGTFRLSVSLVLQLSNILTYPGLNWKYEFLYLPFIMPFVLVSLFTMFVFRKDLQRTPREIFGVVTNRLANPAIALLGALSLVQLLVKIDTAAPAYILGTVLSDWFKEAFIIIVPLLGALGSFFSGSTTVSNLTFGIIQALAAESIGVSKTSMLALQAVGASAGNGVCLNNIIAACAVVGLNIGEGAILKQTYKFVLGITTISTVVMLALFLRF